jgi:hypothetical protein
MIVVVIVLRMDNTFPGFSVTSILSNMIPAGREDTRHRAAGVRDMHFQPHIRQPFVPYLMHP